jgi:hypothetical protein
MLGVSAEEAARRVATVDRERDRFVKDHFVKEASDPRLYDLVLNSPRLSAAGCADLVVDALRLMQARGRPGPGEPPAQAR